MGKVTGFLEIEREDRDYQPVAERVKHWHEFVLPLPEKEIREQAARCMDCGVPYCHGTSRITGAPTGCPVNNQIPDWNDLVYRGNSDEAARNLHSTNNSPEFTGRVCPAPCEASAALLQHRRESGHHQSRSNARSPIARSRRGSTPTSRNARPARKLRLSVLVPRVLPARSNSRVRAMTFMSMSAGPRPAGCFATGFLDFKMEKIHVDRRVEQMQGEGVVFHYNADVGVTMPADNLLKDHDAVVLAGGSEKPRDLPIPGRELKGVHFAMEFLPQQNRRVSNEAQTDVEPILAKGKKVIVIGGGDTGSDCIGTSIRQGAASVTNFEIMSQPPEHADKMLTWPDWPLSCASPRATRKASPANSPCSPGDSPAKMATSRNCIARMSTRSSNPSPVPNSRSMATWCCSPWVSFTQSTRVSEIASASALDQRGNVSADTNALRYIRAEGVCCRRHTPRPVAGGMGDP